MQEEVTQKTIAFSIKSAKLTIQVLQAAARKFLETQNKGKTKLHHGQQSLKQLKKHELVADAFASLPEQEQGILILHCVLELADGEIGGLVGMSRSAVQRHRTKALNELRKRLEDERRKPK